MTYQEPQMPLRPEVEEHITYTFRAQHKWQYKSVHVACVKRGGTTEHGRHLSEQAVSP